MRKWKIGIMVMLMVSVCAVAVAGTIHHYRASELKRFPSTIFAQMDSYMAVSVEDERYFSFYLLYRNKIPFEGRKIERLMLGEEEAVSFVKTEILEGTEGEYYNSMSLSSTITFLQAGRYVYDEVGIQFADGNIERYPIGRLVVDVYDEKGSDALNTYVTTAMNTLTYRFPCKYLKQYEGDVQLVELEMDLLAEHETIMEVVPYYFGDPMEEPMGEAEQAFACETFFQSDKEVVYRYVLPRVHILVDGEPQVVYPMFGCYCGGAAITVDEVLQAYEDWHLETAL